MAARTTCVNCGDSLHFDASTRNAWLQYRSDIVFANTGHSVIYWMTSIDPPDWFVARLKGKDRADYFEMFEVEEALNSER